MVRRNEDITLSELKSNIKEWFSVEFGCDIDMAEINRIINDMIQKDIEMFTFKRLGHLKGEDLRAFRKIWNEPEETELQKLAREKAAQVADDAGVAGQGKESPVDAGEGVQPRPNLDGKRHRGNGSKQNNRG